MSGQWPPGWEDPEDLELEPEGLDAETDVRLSEVTAFLAAVPAPVLPGTIESRILAALAVEEAARAAEPTARAEDSTATAPEPDAPRILRPRPATPARVRRRIERGRRFPRIRPAVAAWPLAACLFFAGIGYAASLSGSSSSSSAPFAESMPSAAAPAGSSAAAAAGNAGPQMGYSRSAAGSAASTGEFAFISSGTHYQAATLAAQVRAVITATQRKPAPVAGSPSYGSASAAPSVSTPASSAASSSGNELNGLASVSALTPGLRGCVVHFTGRVAPRLVDRASFDGTPAYVIASDSHVWVVGLGCTAAHPDLIASAPLAR